MKGRAKSQRIHFLTNFGLSKIWPIVLILTGKRGEISI